MVCDSSSSKTPPSGIEPETLRLTAARSNQLSYRGGYTITHFRPLDYIPYMQQSPSPPLVLLSSSPLLLAHSHLCCVSAPAHLRPASAASHCVLTPPTPPRPSVPPAPPSARRTDGTNTRCQEGGRRAAGEAQLADPHAVHTPRVSATPATSAATATITDATEIRLERRFRHHRPIPPPTPASRLLSSPQVRHMPADD